MQLRSESRPALVFVQEPAERVPDSSRLSVASRSRSRHTSSPLVGLWFLSLSFRRRRRVLPHAATEAIVLDGTGPSAPFFVQPQPSALFYPDHAETPPGGPRRIARRVPLGRHIGCSVSRPAAKKRTREARILRRSARGTHRGASGGPGWPNQSPRRARFLVGFGRLIHGAKPWELLK